MPLPNKSIIITVDQIVSLSPVASGSPIKQIAGIFSSGTALGPLRSKTTSPDAATFSIFEISPRGGYKMEIQCDTAGVTFNGDVSTEIVGSTLIAYRLGEVTSQNETVTLTITAVIPNPVITTDFYPTTITSTAANLAGAVDPRNFPIATGAVNFEIARGSGQDGAGGAPFLFDYLTPNLRTATLVGTRSPNTTLGSGTYSYALSGLSPNTVYYYRISATPTGKTPVYGIISGFRTLSAAPTIVSITPPEVRSKSAAVFATINSNNSGDVSYQFAWKLVTASTWEYSYSRNSGSGISVITQYIPSLIPNTAYNLKLFVSNSLGSTTATSSFTTLLERPIITTENLSNFFNSRTSVADNITQTGVRMHGWVYANGITTGTYSAVKIAFQYGADTAMPSHPVLAGGTAGFQTISITTSTTPDNAVVGDKVIATNGLATTNSAEIFISAIDVNDRRNLILTTTAGNTFSSASTAAPDTSLKFIVYTSPIAYIIKTSLREAGEAIYETITGLSINSLYHYRIVGFTGSATNYDVPLARGADRTFTTLPGVVVTPPFVPVVPTFSEDSDENYAEPFNNFAGLYGNISNFAAIQDQRAAQTSSLPLLKYFFQYSTTPRSSGWDELTPHTITEAVNPAAQGDIFRNIEGLTPNTRYYYRIGVVYVDANKAPFTYYSNVVSFITTNFTSITTTIGHEINDNYTYDSGGFITSALSTSGMSVVLRGSLNYQGLGSLNVSPISTKFEYSYNSNTPLSTTQVDKSRNFVGEVFAVLNDLDRSKTYQYRLVTETTLQGAASPTTQYGEFITIPASALADSITTGGTENHLGGDTLLNITGVLNSTSRTNRYLFSQYVRAADGIDISISDSIARASLNSLPSWNSAGVQRTADQFVDEDVAVSAGIDSYYYETSLEVSSNTNITTSTATSTNLQLHAVIVTLAAANTSIQQGQAVSYSTTANPTTWLTMGSNIVVHSVSGTEVILVGPATANYFSAPPSYPVAGNNIRFALPTTSTYTESSISAITPRDVAFAITLTASNNQIIPGQRVSITNATSFSSTSDVVVYKITGTNLIIKSATSIAVIITPSTAWALAFFRAGVVPGKKYYYRVCASTDAAGGGVVLYGDTRYFIAGLKFPTATTVEVSLTDGYVTQPAAGTGYFKDRPRDASGQAPLTAKLKGTINTGYHSTRWWFEYQPCAVTDDLPTFTSSDVFWTTKNDTYPPLYLESWLPAYVSTPNDYYYNNSQVDHQYNSTDLTTTSSLSFLSADWRQMRTIGTGPYSIELEVGGYGDGGINLNNPNILTAGLQANTRYAYRLVTETNEYEGVAFSLNPSENLAPYNHVIPASPYKVYGEVKYFTTPPRNVEAYLTNNAGDNTTNITKNSATIAAGINLGNPVLGPASCFFEYTLASDTNFTSPAFTLTFLTDLQGLQFANITGLSPATIYHYRLAIKPYGATAYVKGTPETMQIQEFKTSNADMAISNITSTNLLGNSAKINATITSNGKPARLIVKYGTIDGAPNRVSATKYITTNLNEDVAYFIDLTNLSPRTQYYYKLDVSNQDASITSASYNFTTPSGSAIVAPVISMTASAPGVYVHEPDDYSHATTEVILRGILNPNGDTATSYYFEYGLRPGKYTTKTEMKVVIGQTPQTVSEKIINLNSDLAYYYRLVGKNNIGTTYGAERVLNGTGVVRITLDAPTDITPVHATLHGNINLLVEANISYQFQYDITNNFSDSREYKFTPARIVQSRGNNMISMLIKDLTPDTLYYYRLVINDGRPMKIASEIKSFVANTSFILEKENPRIVVGKIVSGGNIMVSNPPITVSKVSSRKKVITLSGINLVNTPNAILIVTPTTPLIFT